jgi:hypothetical protein
MLIVIILSVITLNVIMLNVAMVNVIMLNECRYAECRYAESRYAECRFAESRGGQARIFSRREQTKKFRRFCQLSKNFLKTGTNLMMNFTLVTTAVNLAHRHRIYVDCLRAACLVLSC